MKSYKILLFLSALLLALSLPSLSYQKSLSDKIVRLHILANSDSDEDQALKLKVRDGLLKTVDMRTGCYSKDKIDGDFLKTIEKTATEIIKENGFDYGVTAKLTNMYFDTRVYDGFALPCGNYDAVRVEIGSAQGKNWWCVLFPPLCMPLAGESVEDIASEAGLTKDDIGLITRDGEVYALRFKTAEIYGKIKGWIDTL